MAEVALQELKLEVRKYYGRIYSAVKARELQTLRQIEAVWRRRLDAGLTPSAIDICFDNEEKIFQEIKNFGIIDFKKLNLDSDIFLTEDYVSPNEDHMYSYKCLDELHESKDSDNSDLEAAIEKDAFEQVTNNDRCVCYVHVSPDEVSKKFKEPEQASVSTSSSDTSVLSSVHDISEEKCSNCEEKCERCPPKDISIPEQGESKPCDVVKTTPTQEWLNRIITETETEPSQIIDLMEHSAIECS